MSAEKMRGAYRRVRTAVEAGQLTRPSHCQECGCSNRPTKDGRSYLQAHHHGGYDRPLDVIWLCCRCHRVETPLPAVIGAPSFGSANGRARLSENQVHAIRASSETNVALAARYGVANQTISDIRHRKKWSWLAERERR